MDSWSWLPLLTFIDENNYKGTPSLGTTFLAHKGI